MVTRKVYMQPKLNLGIGDKTATLKRVPIFPTTMGSGIDDLYGNLGQDVVEKFDSFTLDFSAMTRLAWERRCQRTRSIRSG